MSVIIKVENISKQYRLGKVGTGTISHDLNRWWHTIRGKEDPYLKIGEANNRTDKGESDYVWSLKDVSFEVRQGEVLGIIGRNGAGKSTLLKILSRTTAPTTGAVKIKGRVASLLEVGTGFHPELTGRENVFLNGAILGMTRREIKSKFEEIIDFAGVERYIDTPVKRYSSGMYVRLAFGVAAHLEPEILIVDEVLAVGDAEFQKKAVGKMKDVSSKDGRTVLFVSHNMAAVRNLCNKGIVMANGRMDAIGSIDHAISHYQDVNARREVNLSNFERKGRGRCRIIDISLFDEKKSLRSIFKLGEKMNIAIKVARQTQEDYKNIRVIIGVYNLAGEGYLRFDSKTMGDRLDISHQQSTIICYIDENLNIRPDTYVLNIAIFQDGDMDDYIDGVGKFDVENHDYFQTGQGVDNPELSKLFYKHSWGIS